MADDSKINIYVNSKNRRTDETSSNFNVIIPDGLLKVNNNQSFELNVISFNCVNSFYHCNNNTNRFQIIFRNNLNNLYMVQDYYLTNGNPNVYDVLNNINTLTSVYMTTTYNRITNKYSFTRIYAQTTNYYNMYIKPYNSYNFFGLVNSVEFLINFNATETGADIRYLCNQQAVPAYPPEGQPRCKYLQGKMLVMLPCLNSTCLTRASKSM